MLVYADDRELDAMVKSIKDLKRDLAAERAQNEGLRRYLAHLELHRWCVICNEIRALLSARLSIL